MRPALLYIAAIKPEGVLLLIAFTTSFIKPHELLFQATCTVVGFGTEVTRLCRPW